VKLTVPGSFNCPCSYLADLRAGRLTAAGGSRAEVARRGPRPHCAPGLGCRSPGSSRRYQAGEVAQSVCAGTQDRVRAYDSGDDLAGQRQPVTAPAPDPPVPSRGERPAVRGDCAARPAHDAGKVGVPVQQAGNVRVGQPVTAVCWRLHQAGD